MKKSFVSKYFTTTGPQNIYTRSESKMKMAVSADGNILNTHGKNIHISTTPKRKLLTNILEGSPAKIQKIRENFNYLTGQQTLPNLEVKGNPELN